MTTSQLVDFVKAFLITLVLIVIVFLVLYKSGGKYIKDNWPKFRCNPLIIPIAGMFGKSTQKNAQQCFYKTFKYFFDFLMRPFQYIIQIIHKLLGGLFQDINAFRTLLKPIRLFILNATQKFYDTLNSFMASIFYSFAKTKSILGRMGGLFRLTIYTLETIQFSIKSIWDGPIGQVSRKWPPKLGKVKKFFCLIPSSLVKLENNKYCELSKLKINTRLKSHNTQSNKLIGMVKVFVSNCDLYKYKKTWCSGDHMIFHINCWKRVKDILEPVCKYTGYLLSPITQQNIFITENQGVFRDYEESTKYDNFILIKNLTYLNKRYWVEPCQYNSIGLTLDSIITCNGIEKKVLDYKIGDFIDKDRIIGFIDEINQDSVVFKIGKLVFGGRQIIYDNKRNCWTTVSNLKNTEKILISREIILRCFITQSNYLRYNSLIIASCFDGISEKINHENDEFIIDMINLSQHDNLDYTVIT